MTSYLTKFYRNIICNDLSLVKNDSCLYDAESHLYYIIIWGNLVPYNHDMTLYLLLYVVYLRINLDHPKLSNSAAKKLLVLCSTTFICQCTLIVSPAGKLENVFQKRLKYFMVLLQFLRKTSRLVRMPSFPEPKFRGPKRTKMPTPQTRVELHIHLDGSLRMETVWELYKEKG